MSEHIGTYVWCCDCRQLVDAKDAIQLPSGVYHCQECRG